jgi:hypothetical protein
VVNIQHTRCIFMRPWENFLEGNKMSKKPSNYGTQWNLKQVAELRQLANQNTPMRVIGLKMERSPGAVAQKASEEHISLKPTNQSPYNRLTKYNAWVSDPDCFFTGRRAVEFAL